MSWTEGDDESVTALRFDEPAAAADLALWCGGDVARTQDDERAVVVLVPTAGGAVPAQVGDWIVRSGAGSYRAYRHADFAARFTASD